MILVVKAEGGGGTRTLLKIAPKNFVEDWLPRTGGCSDRHTVAKDGSVEIAYPTMPRVRSSPLALRVMFGIAHPPSIWRTKCKMITPRK